jgi:drug/metabolite transporter (DMT)-like permease
VIKSCSLTAWQVASFRSGIAAAALVLTHRAGYSFATPRAMAVGLAYAATMVLFVSANKLTTAANTIFLQSTAPMYLLLLGPWLLGERIRRSDLGFVALIALGMTLFFIGIEPPRVTAPDPRLGNLLAIGSGFTWALTVLGLRWLGRDGASGSSAVAAAVAGNVIACVACLPAALPVAGARIMDVGYVLYLGLFQIGLAYALMTRGIRHVGALEASLLLMLEPVLNAVWAFWIHGEVPGAWSLAGCAILLATTVTFALRRS